MEKMFTLTDNACVDELPLDSAHAVLVPTVVVDDGHVVVTDVALLLVGLGIRLGAGHQRGRVIHNLQVNIVKSESSSLKASLPGERRPATRCETGRRPLGPGPRGRRGSDR